MSLVTERSIYELLAVSADVLCGGSTTVTSSNPAAVLSSVKIDHFLWQIRNLSHDVYFNFVHKNDVVALLDRDCTLNASYPVAVDTSKRTVLV